MNAKSILFTRVLPEFKKASPYFTTAAITRRAQELDPGINLDSLAVYLSGAQDVATTILNQFLVQIAVLQRNADSRVVNIKEIEEINQRQVNASVGVS